jgi:hypothetical protein
VSASLADDFTSVNVDVAGGANVAVVVNGFFWLRPAAALVFLRV